jgi:hypothetical protein
MVNPTHAYPPTTEPGPFNINRYARIGLHELSDGTFVNASPGAPLPVSEEISNTAIANGSVSGTKYIYKFGFNSDINGDEETICENGGIYVYPTTAARMYVNSTSVNDTAGGTGVRSIRIFGLDANYNEVSETFTMAGQAQTLTANTYIRVYRAYALTSGSLGTSAGIIYIANGAGLNASFIPTGAILANLGVDNQTQLALWTVPANYTFYLSQVDFTAAVSLANTYMTTKLKVREFGGVFRTLFINVLQSGTYVTDLKVPLVLPEKTDIECRAFSSGNNNPVSASFAGIYRLNQP